MQDIHEALKKISLFSKLPDEMIAYLVGEVHERTLLAGAILFKEGDRGDALYFILEGSLEITQVAGSNREIVLATFKTGDYFGEMSLLDEKPRSASARAVTDCRLLALDREDFAVLLEKNPAIAIQLSRAISERLRKTTPFTNRVIPQQVAEAVQETSANQVKVFISYSRRDKAFVQKVHDAVKKSGLDVWVDWENIPLTSDWWAEIQRGIENADAFAFVISPDSLNSKVCGDEIQTAVNANKRLIPILFREAEKNDQIPANIGATNWVYMRSEEELASNLPEMLRIIHTDLEWVQDHTRLLVRAGEWSQSGRDTSFLLRGTDLSNAENWLTKAATIDDPKPTPLHKEYINASVQDARNTRLATRRQRIFLGSISVALIVTIVLTIFAIVNYQNAEIARIEANNLRSLAETAQADAESARLIAESNQALAEVQRATAEAASTAALEQEGIARQQANAASTAAVEEAQQREIALTQGAEAENQRQAAEDARVEANIQRDLALSRQRAAQALSYLDSQPDLAALLSMEAYATSNTLEAKNALLTILQQGLGRQIIPITPPVPIQLTPLYSVALSPDGEHLAFGGENGTLVIWNYVTGKPEHSFTTGSGKIIWWLAFSPDGNTLASAGIDGYVYFWDVATGKQISKVYRGNVILSLAWSPDGTRIAMVLGARVAILNIETKEIIEKNLAFGVTEVAWSPDGNKIAASNKDDLIYIFEPTALGVIATLVGHTADVQSVAWGPDSNLLASGGSDKTVRLWSVKDGQQIAVMDGHLGEILSVSISTNGKILASAGTDRQLILWDTDTFEQIAALKPFTNEIHSLTFIPTVGKIILAAASRDKTVELYEIKTEQRLSEVLSTDLGPIYSLSLDALGTPFALSNQTRNEMEIAPLSPEQAPSSNIPESISAPGAIQSAALNLDGSVSVLGYTTGRILIQNYASDTEIEFSMNGAINSLAFSADGQYLVASTCYAAVQAPDCESSEIKIWDVGIQQEIASLTGQPGKVVSIAFSADNTQLASGSDDASIWLWDVAKKAPIGLPLNRHEAAVTSLAFSPDGGLLASGSADTTIILWDLITRQPIGEPLAGAGSNISALVFREDGNVLYAGGADGNVYQWEINIDNWLNLACQLAGRNFTKSEWAQFFGDTAYQTTCSQWPTGE